MPTGPDDRSSATGWRRQGRADAIGCSVSEAEKLTDWLARNVARSERRPDRVRNELLVRCRAERIEPPERTRVERVVRSALHKAEETLFAQVTSRLSTDTMVRLEALVADGIVASPASRAPKMCWARSRQTPAG